MEFFKYILLFFVLSCSINSELDVILNQSKVIIENEKNPFLTMRRTPCYGKCPTYTLNIFSNGDIIYEGTRFVEKIGLYKSTIDIKKIALIEDKIKLVDFFNFEEIYDARVTDLPSTIIEVNLKEKSHKVIGRYKVPIAFKSLSNFIDEVILGIENWEKIIE